MFSDTQIENLSYGLWIIILIIFVGMAIAMKINIDDWETGHFIILIGIGVTILMIVRSIFTWINKNFL
jgi:hypothetical protein